MKRHNLTILLSALVIALGVMVPAAWGEFICPLDTLKPRKVENLEAFQRIPILHEGRIKPIDTYAKHFLVQLSGRSRYQKESSIEWFARFLFAPRTTFTDKVFMINNPEILEAIKVEPQKKRRYSYRDIEGGFDKIKELATVISKMDDKERSAVEREILRLYGNMVTFVRLSGAFMYGFPHPDFTIQNPDVRKKLELPQDRDQFSFYDMFVQSDELSAIVMPLSTRDRSDWSNTEKDVVRLINGMYFWSEQYSNCPLGIIPTMDHESEFWISPMDAINLTVGAATYSDEVKFIRNMTVHYWNNDQLEFDINARSFVSSISKRLSPVEAKAVSKIPFELKYNKFNLLLWAKFLYGLAFFVFLFSLMSDNKLLYKATLAITGIGFLTHAMAMILRMMIMSRPPVSNLYETFIFVGFVSVITGFIIEKINRNWLGLAIASISGFIFLMISGKFASEGDTMQMLVAVLNSNFWLSTHVLSITTGYAGCCVAGIIGHIYILQAVFKPKSSKTLQVTLNNLLAVLGFGLTMTFLGTALGGIWADQSWGRFWGWDPKENGALMIVLWCAILFHARMAGLIRPLGLAIGSVLGLIVVMWAWFGVNLLSVGLHSYGFTSGLANALMIYVVVELIFLIVTTTMLTKKNIKI